LGRYAKQQLGQLGDSDGRIDKTLDYLYAREYKKRGVEFGKGPGSMDPTQMAALNWLGEAKKLFPESVFETLQDHALDRYEITDLLNDPKTLESLEPNQNLLKVLLSFHGRANPQVKQKLRGISKSVIDDIMARLKPKVSRAFSGRRNRFLKSNIASAANFDWRRTLRQNLKTYDPERQRIIAEQLRFNSRERRRLPWRVILCVDQSGSMTDSLIYAAVMGAILTGLPGISTKMILFDTSIVDVSDKLTDPLDTLLSVQLGGGTDIGRAVQYCEQFVDNGDRTIFVLLTDFCEGASPRALYSATARLAEQRVKLLGLAGLDDSGHAEFDQAIAGKMASLGMKIGAMTPDRFAQWLAETIQ
jgi:Mg-chelatase subunit ChlD